MTGRVRETVSAPACIDYTQHPVRPLLFFLPTQYAPSGIVERQSEGIVLSHHPWYTEIAVDLEDRNDPGKVTATVVLYLIPYGEDPPTFWLAACLDAIVQPMFDVMTGHDFGDEVTPLVAMRWPEQFAMLFNSNAQNPRTRILAGIATAERLQWVVADQLAAHEVEEVSGERLMSLIGATAETFSRMVDPAVELPGLVGALGGPDRLMRRLGTAGEILGSLGDIAGVLGGTSSPFEIVNIVQDVKGIVERLGKD